MEFDGKEYTVEYDSGFTFVKPQKIECRLVGCKHYDSCMSVGQGILPQANSILEVLALDWVLPGHGSAYDDCGSWRYRGCLNVSDHVQSELFQSVEGKAYVEWYHRSCYRSECPICYEKWGGKEAGKIEWRLKHYWKFGKILHVTVSPNEKDVLNLPYEKLRAKAYRIAKQRGIKGGCLIWHPKREADNGRWYYSPHFHILGFGWVRNTAEGYAKDGWVVKNIVDVKRERSVFQTALYQLSHCGISVHRKHRTVCWFGVCSPAAKTGITVPPMEKEKHLCPCCGAELIQLRYFGDPDLLPDKEEGASAWMDPAGFFEVEGG